MLAIFLHDFIGPCEEDGRSDESQVDKDLPLHVLEIFVRDVDE